MFGQPTHDKTAAASKDLIERARAPLYRDPFEGLCAHARALSPELRRDKTQNCPRCGRLADPEAINPEAGCLLEGLSLDLASLQAARD